MPVETWTVEPSATRDVVLVLDHFRPERHAVTQLYNKHFLGVVYIVDATGWPGCLKLRPAQACKLQSSSELARRRDSLQCVPSQTTANALGAPSPAPIGTACIGVSAVRRWVPTTRSTSRRSAHALLS